MMSTRKEDFRDNTWKMNIASATKDAHESDVDAHLLSPYNETNINANLQYDHPRTTLRDRVSACCRLSPRECLYRTLPVSYWLPRYKWKDSIVGDVIAGITVGVMHVPQGMAYGLLGNVPPIVGIYMAYFPVLMYTLLGTSRHASMGTFGVVCLMTGKIVSKYGTDDFVDRNGTRTFNPEMGPNFPIYTNLDVAITVTFTVAIWQIIMYIFRLGIVANLLSETFVNGFTCACSTYVVGAMAKDIFGLPIEKRRGWFAFPLTLYDVMRAIPLANRCTMYISIICMAFMIVNLYVFKPLVAKLTKVPIPIEIIMVCLGTLISYLFSFNEQFQVTIVGPLPTGIPQFSMPKFELVPTIAVETIGVTVVSYIITISMALMLAYGEQYEVDGNQELLALGVSNVVGSFFSAMPITASLSRSVIQKVVGGISQIASVISAIFLTAILLWVGPIFQFLPRSVLACIIVMALRSLYLQVRFLPTFWRNSKWDGVLWIATFVTTLFISIDIGLIVGVSISVINLFYSGQTAYTCLLGLVPNTEIYLDIARFKAAEEFKHMKIFHYAGSLNFATKQSFRRDFLQAINLKNDRSTKMIIIDFSALVNLDPSGGNQLIELRKEMKQNSVEILIAGCSPPIFEVLRHLIKNSRKEENFELFPRVHDAVLYAKMTLGENGNDT